MTVGLVDSDPAPLGLVGELGFLNKDPNEVLNSAALSDENVVLILIRTPSAPCRHVSKGYGVLLLW